MRCSSSSACWASRPGVCCRSRSIRRSAPRRPSSPPSGLALRLKKWNSMSRYAWRSRCAESCMWIGIAARAPRTSPAWWCGLPSRLPNLMWMPLSPACRTACARSTICRKAARRRWPAASGWTKIRPSCASASTTMQAPDHWPCASRRCDSRRASSRCRVSRRSRCWALDRRKCACWSIARRWRTRI